MKNVLCITLNPAVDVSCDAGSIRPIRKIRTRNETHYPGGGGVNVARVISKLGGTSELLYLSGGASGELLEDCLETHLPHRHRHRLPIAGSTRIAYVVHELQSGQEFRFVPEGPQVSAQEVDLVIERIRQFEKLDGGYIVASGSLPQGAPADTYSRIAEVATLLGARLILDSSGVGLQHTLAHSSVYLVKPSMGELERLVNQQLDEDGARKAALDLVSNGSAQFVAVSMGEQGAFLASRNGVLKIAARRVKVRSAVGAGDSFVGGLVSYLSQDYPLEDAFSYGVAAGAAAVMTEGTELCRRDDVQALYRAECAEHSS